eukprot:1376527-Prymnesium_polylepis.1
MPPTTRRARQHRRCGFSGMIAHSCLGFVGRCPPDHPPGARPPRPVPPRRLITRSSALALARPLADCGQPEAHDGGRGAGADDAVVPRLWRHDGGRRQGLVRLVRHRGQGRRDDAPHLGARAATTPQWLATPDRHTDPPAPTATP